MVQKFLQHGQRLDVEIVGRLIQEEDVGLVDQRAQQIEPPPFAAAEAADARPLHGAGRETTPTSAAASTRSPSLVVNQRRFVFDELDDTHLVVQIFAALVVVAELNRLAPD